MKNKTKQMSVHSNNFKGIIAFPLQFLQELGSAIKWLKPQRAIIFGSAVKKGLKARDIDLLILADTFKHYLWQDRFKLINLPKGPIYDVRLYTPVEFETFYPLKNPIRISIESQNIDLEEFYA